MSVVSNDVQAYLDVTYDSWFWKWTDDGRTVIWQDGTTIAFREELAQILRHLAPRGLPTLDAIILLLAACRASWATCRSQLAAYQPLDLRPLDRIASLPDTMRSSLNCRMILAEQVFEASTGRLNEKMSAKVIDQLAWFSPRRTLFAPLRASSSSLAGTVRLLEDGLQNVDEASLRLRMQTSLDQLPEAATFNPLSDVERMQRLLTTLTSDGDVSGMARLVKRLMAAITVPRPLLQRDDMQLGGVSDLTNRGPLDRLLLSELAHDDLVFSARMALNELLFLQRESPPKDSPEFRAILVDTGLRMWGAPRVFATAVAMALMATGSKKTSTRIYRAMRDQLVRADLASIEGLVDHLAALEHDAHPGHLLKPFQLEVTEQDNATLPILVTCPEVVEDSEFLAELQRSALTPLLIATVDRSGQFRLISHGLHEQRAVSAADLSLDDLFPDRIGRARRLVRSVRDDQGLPEEMFQEPHALCQPYDLNLATSATSTFDRQAMIIVSHDRRVLCYDSSDRHAVQLITALPHGAVYWVPDRTPDGCLTAIIENLSENKTYLLKIETRDDTYTLEPVQLIGDGSLQAVATYQGYLFLIRRASIDLLNAQGGVMSRASIPHGFTFSGLHRYFHSYQHGWSCLAVTDGSIVFEPLPKIERPYHASMLAKLIDYPATDGPLGLLKKDGQLLDLASNQITHQLTLSDSLVIVDIRAQSRDLRRCIIQVEEVDRKRRHVVSHIVRRNAADRGSVVSVEERELQVPLKLEEFRPKSLRDHTRFRFSHASVHSASGAAELILWQGLTGRALRLKPEPSGTQVLVLDTVDRSNSARANKEAWDANNFDVAFDNRVQFEPFRPRKLGIQLSLATLASGQRLILDTRAMLHFVPRDLHALSLSIILLNQGEIAGRLSDGRWFGPLRFHREPNASKWVSSHDVFSDFLLPFLKA